MILAIDSNTGSEHDIKEEWVGYTDAVYAEMGKLIRKKTGLNDMKVILKWPEDKRRRLCSFLLSQGDFLERQVEKYLQLPAPKRKKKYSDVTFLAFTIYDWFSINYIAKL